jgi:hypothetical protein
MLRFMVAARITPSIAFALQRDFPNKSMQLHCKIDLPNKAEGSPDGSANAAN